MKKITTFLVSISLFLLLFAPFTTNAATPGIIEPGDTFIYKINEWDVPWAEISSTSDPGFDVNELILDLSGSTLGVKVMDTYKGIVFNKEEIPFSTTNYFLDFYVILGKTIVIPLPDDAPEDVKNAYGESIEFEEGIGLGVGSIPGTDFLEFIVNTTEDPAIGIPFYLNPSEWNTYELFLHNVLGDITHTITNVAGEDFLVNINGETEDGVFISLTARWFNEGDDAGVFKSIDGSVDGDVDDDGVGEHLAANLEFERKEHNPLPAIIKNKGSLDLKLETVDMEYVGSGFFQDENVTALLDTAEFYIESLNQETLLTYDVTDVYGCYYNTTITYHELPIEFTIPEMEEMPEEIPEEIPILWDGFTGAPVFLGEFLGINTYYDIIDEDARNIPVSVGILPLLAPGITPDWDMWKGSTKTMAEFLQLTEKGIKQSAEEPEFKSGGGNLNSFDLLYEMRESGDVKFFYAECKFDLEWKASNMESYGEPFIATSEVRLKGTVTGWFAYSSEGALAGIGSKMDITLFVTDFPSAAITFLLNAIYGETEILIPISVPGETISGDLNVKINIQAETGQVSEIPNPEDATKIAGAEGAGGLTPGFEAISVLIVMVATVVFIRKRK